MMYTYMKRNRVSSFYTFTEHKKDASVLCFCFEIVESKHPILIAFSVYTNGRKILHTTESSSQILCFNGIKVISMFWVIAGHRYSAAQSLQVINIDDTFKVLNSIFFNRFSYLLFAILVDDKVVLCVYFASSSSCGYILIYFWCSIIVNFSSINEQTRCKI